MSLRTRLLLIVCLLVLFFGLVVMTAAMNTAQPGADLVFIGLVFFKLTVFVYIVYHFLTWRDKFKHCFIPNHVILASMVPGASFELFVLSLTSRESDWNVDAFWALMCVASALLLSRMVRRLDYSKLNYETIDE